MNTITPEDSSAATAENIATATRDIADQNTVNKSKQQFAPALKHSATQVWHFATHEQRPRFGGQLTHRELTPKTRQQKNLRIGMRRAM